MSGTQEAPEAVPPSEAVGTAANADSTSTRVRRTAPQLLADQLIAADFVQARSETTTSNSSGKDLNDEELIRGAPSRNGGRLLTADRDPWTHNAWDQVEWGLEEEAFAQSALERQRGSPVPQHLQDQFNADPAAQWDTFYAHNKDNFFKDRAWLQNEFPELKDCLRPDAGPKRVVELGCGNGSTLFPLLAANENPQLDLHGYDYSKEAVGVVKGHASFDPERCTCEVWDLSSNAGIPRTVEPHSVDILTMIFVFSALHPDEWAQAVENVHRMLRPGGLLLFRDYGRNDLAMLRFKANRYMQDGLYVRGDNTRVYFFERDELVHIFGGVRASAKAPESSRDPTEARTQGTESAGDAAATVAATAAANQDTTTVLTETDSGVLSASDDSSLPASLADLSIAPSAAASPAISRPETPIAQKAASRTLAGSLTPFRLDLLQLGVDRRLILNRKRQIKMFRVWMQGRWRKPLLEADRGSEAAR